MTETDIQRLVQIEASKQGLRLFRNQTGMYKLQDGRVLQSGLAKGSADLIGWKTMEITPDMVGQKIAVFLSVEVKSAKGKLSPEQTNWLNTVNQVGGIAIVARSPQDIHGI
jgi:hypothetical protein